MRRSSLLLWLLALAGVAIATKVELTNDSPEQCFGMYSQEAWGGDLVPNILVQLLGYKKQGDDDPNDDPVVAALVFEWQDAHLIGVPFNPEDPEAKQYICDDEAIEQNYCNPEDRGTYIISANATEVAGNDIDTKAIHTAKEDRSSISYGIQKTGYFCVSTAALGDFEYTAVATFRNSYGELPGSQIAKLPFYGGLAIVYAVICVFWAFLYVQNRQDILPVQNYITAILLFLVLEMIATWGYYNYLNIHGSDGMAKFLVVVVSILNAGRSSFSFFLLLIVCMGYGVVTSNLGRRMTYARILTGVHFVFGVIYAIASLTITPEDAGPLVLLVVLPLAATLTAFYIWTLNALAATRKDLIARKQRVKATMYKKLWWCILASVLIIFGFFFINSFTFAGQGNPDFTPNHWQSRWFVLDGWLNLVYLADIMFIAYLWRPTANNRRFAMSDEIAQDDEGFEIASIRDSLDDIDEEANGDTRPPAYEHGANGGYGVESKPIGRGSRGASPLPAPKPQRPLNTRQSLDGETIFAVGEDDNDFDSDDEGRRLRKAD